MTPQQADFNPQPLPSHHNRKDTMATRTSSSPLRTVPLLIAASFAATALAPTLAAAAGHDSPITHAAVAATKEVVQRYVLKTGVADGKLVFLDEQGRANPVLRATVGDMVELVMSSGEGAEHDIAIPELGVTSEKFRAGSAPVTLRFKAEKGGTFTYICTIAGHRQVGMEGTMEVAGAGGVEPADASGAGPVRAAAPPQKLPLANPGAVSVTMDPAAVPPPIGDRMPQLRKYRIETVELSGKLDDGTTFTYWTFDKKVPGPMMRVRVGDTVQLTLANAKGSTQCTRSTCMRSAGATAAASTPRLLQAKRRPLPSRRSTPDCTSTTAQRPGAASHCGRHVRHDPGRARGRAAGGGSRVLRHAR
jgi:nitrite reductase (NO-forming)